MKRLLVSLGCVAALAVGGSEPRPEPVMPDDLDWIGPPGNPALKGAWVVGSEDSEGQYIFRVKLAKGGTIPPHTHPDTRYSTVLSGTLYVGFGTEMIRDDVVAVPTGAVYEAPANVPHYLLALDGDVLYEEVGIGPTSMIPVEISD